MEVDRSSTVWAKILASEAVHVGVAIVKDAVVATATLITAPNLLRGGRHHAFLENVATHPDCQGEGHGRAIVCFLLKKAWQDDCHHVLLQSGRADPRVRSFYVGLGFVPDLRTAYVANRPD